MKKSISEKASEYIIACIPMLAIFVFLSVTEPSHLRFLEQNQMFLFTSDYLKGALEFPGGPAVYLGRFLAQFCISPVVGAAVIALLAGLIHWLMYLVLGRKGLFGRVLALIPAVILAWYMCDENALLSGFVAVGGGLGAALPLRRRRLTPTILLTPAVYFLCGPVGSLVFAVAAAIRCERIAAAPLSLAAAFLCCLLSTRLFDYPFIRLLTGPHYSRYHDTIPLLPWLAAASTALAAVPAKLVKTPSVAVTRLAFIAVFIALCVGFVGFRNADMEELLKYTQLTQRQDWDAILKQAKKKEPVNPIELSCVNMALAQTGQMGEWMFRFRQTGRDGLFYPYRREHVSPIPTSMIYWNLGFLNTCQRFTFAAEEVIPDYQKSSWCHKRLAEIFLTNGEYDIARKYLEPLKYTIFYRRTAKELETLVNHPERIDAHPIYGKERKIMLKDHQYRYVPERLDTPLGYLCAENPDNYIAYQYILALSLLEKDLDRFAARFSDKAFSNVPTAFQEAYILYWSQDHDGPQGLPAFVSQRIIDRFMRFSNDINTRDEQYVLTHYRDTYWFYFFFRNQGQN